MNTLTALLARDELSSAALDALFEAQHRRPGFVRDLLAAFRTLDPEVAWRAVWLLLRVGRASGEMSPEVLRALARRAEEMTHWIARLTLCQLFAQFPCPESSREELFPFLDDCFGDERVIIRAWALTAMYAMKDDERFAVLVERSLAEARLDRKPSMVARIKHLGSARKPPLNPRPKSVSAS